VTAANLKQALPNPRQNQVDRRYRGCQRERTIIDGALSRGGMASVNAVSTTPKQREATRGYIVAQAQKQ
jgi:hypothetical protein